MVIFSIGAFFAKTALEKDKVTIEKGSYVEIDLSKEYKEKGKNLPEFLKGQDTNFFSMLRAFDSIERDGNIKGVVLKLDNLSLDSAQIEEVGKKIDNLKKSKKEVYSYMTMVNNRNYSLAIKSNQIFMPPTMSAPVNITGYYGELMYYKLLADKLGIDKNNLKTTVEEFNKAVRGEIKDPFRENPTKKEFMTEGPYYGVQVESAIHMTRGGVVADEKTQVLYDNGNIVSGLYAAGEVANSNSGAYSAAVIFGRIAGQEAAKYINK